MDMSHTGYFYFFLQVATQHFVAVAGCKTGVLHVKSFLQLVSQQKVARKIASCNMAVRPIYTVQLYRMRYAYGKSMTQIVSCKLNLQLAYDCHVRHKECRGLFETCFKADLHGTIFAYDCRMRFL